LILSVAIPDKGALENVKNVHRNFYVNIILYRKTGWLWYDWQKW